MAKTYEYNVKGAGEFPIDMLRYDQAWPASEMDSYSAYPPPPIRGPRKVRLCGNVQPTMERWKSFGWSVVDD